MQKKLVDAKISCNFASNLRRLIFHINLEVSLPSVKIGGFLFPQLTRFRFLSWRKYIFMAHLWILNTLANGAFS